MKENLQLGHKLRRVRWDRMPIGEALDLLKAIDAARQKGVEMVGAVLSRLKDVPTASPKVAADVASAKFDVPDSPDFEPGIAVPPRQPAPTAGALNYGAARMCSMCAEPLTKSVPGPWLNNGVCRDCFTASVEVAE